MKAKYNFVSRKDNELSFAKGDSIKVLDRHKSGWWKGELNGKVGRFPSNYCAQLDQALDEKSKTPASSVSPRNSEIKVSI
jgi:hypothetical protein